MSEQIGDIVIIGAGLGGLLCGAFLAKEGYRVTLLEKNAAIGGGLQSYKRFGTVFDTGMHIFGGMEPGGNIYRICHYLGILDKFATLPLQKDNDVTVRFGDGREYAVSFRGENFVESLGAHFPTERTGLEAYMRAVDGMVDELDLFHLRPMRGCVCDRRGDFRLPADALVEKYVSDPALRAILSLFNAFYAGEKGISAAYLHAVITKIFMNGACRVVGGYSTFAAALEDCILAHGGKIRTNEGVSRILTSNRKIVGVETTKGNLVNADTFISAISPAATIKLLDKPVAYSRVYRSLIAAQPNSMSAFIVNMKLKKGTIPYTDTLYFLYDTPEAVWEDPAGGKITRLMCMTPPETRSDEWASTLNVIVPMRWSTVKKWENTRVGHRGAEYLRFKQKTYHRVMEKLKGIYPDIEACVEAVDTATPLTIRDYTGVAEGAMCGFLKRHDDMLAFMSPATKIPNLFLTGQNINMHGFCGVSMTAIETCEAILGKNHILQKLTV